MMNKRTIIFLIAMGCFFCGSFTPKFGPATKVKTVVIDPGHGGKDPGCHGTKHKEKDVSLSVALKLGNYIEKNFKDVKVIYTRSTDVFVELQERAMIANRNKADLFISIHCNSASHKDKKTKKIIDNPTAHGAETYVMGIKNEQGKLDVAKRENSAILLEDNYVEKYDGFDPNSDEAYIIMNLFTDTYLAQSLNIASKMQVQYKTKAGRNDKGVKRASLWVLWRTYMPSILTEIGFLTNSEEEKFLGSDKGQEYVATSIFRAFRQYKTEVEGTGIKYNDEIENMEAYVAPPQPVELQVKDSVASDNNDTVAIEDKMKEEPKKTIKAKAAGDSMESKIMFKVKFASEPKDLPSNVNGYKAKGISEISHYIEKGAFNYTSGNYTKPDEATKVQNQIRKKGFPKATVVAFRDGKKIPVSDALKALSGTNSGAVKR